MSKQKTEMLLDSPAAQATTQTEAVGAYVLRTLGRPANLIAVQVRPLWEHHYRVNILVGESVAAVTIAHSYFLVMGSDGSCLSVHPRSPANTRPPPGPRPRHDPALESLFHNTCLHWVSQVFFRAFAGFSQGKRDDNLPRNTNYGTNSYRGASCLHSLLSYIVYADSGNQLSCLTSLRRVATRQT